VKELIGKITCRGKWIAGLLCMAYSWPHLAKCLRQWTFCCLPPVHLYSIVIGDFDFDGEAHLQTCTCG